MGNAKAREVAKQPAQQHQSYSSDSRGSGIIVILARFFAREEPATLAPLRAELGSGMQESGQSPREMSDMREVILSQHREKEEEEDDDDEEDDDEDTDGEREEDKCFFNR